MLRSKRPERTYDLNRAAELKYGEAARSCRRSWLRKKPSLKKNKSGDSPAAR